MRNTKYLVKHTIKKKQKKTLSEVQVTDQSVPSCCVLCPVSAGGGRRAAEGVGVEGIGSGGYWEWRVLGDWERLAAAAGEMGK